MLIRMFEHGRAPLSVAGWTGLFAGLIGISWCGSAEAQEAQEAQETRRYPATANVVQLGLGFRYGFDFEEGDFNPWGSGLGLSGGFTMPNAVYLGGNFDYFFGDKINVGGLEQKSNIWQLMAEGGYDFGLGYYVVIRPKAGFGFASVRSESCLSGAGCTSDAPVKLAFAPGANFILMTSKFSLSFDFRYDLVFADKTLNGLIFSAGVGF